MEGGSKVERVRKLFHEEMSTRAVAQYQPLQTSHAYYTSHALLELSDEKKTIADAIEQ